MSAGTGITHSEYNESSTELVNFLQIWILAKKRQIEPRYAQKSINIAQNEFIDIVTPHQKNKNAVWINQNAYLLLTNLDKERTVTYKCKFDNPAIYIFVISGEIVIDNDILKKRDGMALDDLTEIEISANKESMVLCIETIL